MKAWRVQLSRRGARFRKTGAYIHTVALKSPARRLRLYLNTTLLAINVHGSSLLQSSPNYTLMSMRLRSDTEPHLIISCALITEELQSRVEAKAP